MCTCGFLLFFPQKKKMVTVVHTSLSIWKLLSSTIFKVTDETIIHKGLIFMGNCFISFLTIDSTSLPSSFSRKDKLGNVTTEISISTKITVNGFELPTSFVSTQCLSYWFTESWVFGRVFKLLLIVHGNFGCQRIKSLFLEKLYFICNSTSFRMVM